MATSLEATATGATTTTGTTGTTTTTATAARTTALIATTGSLLVAQVFRRGLLCIAQGGGVTGRATFHDRLSKLAEDQLHGAHRVVVGGNDDVGERRIAVRIEDADDRHVHALRFAHGVFFATRVDHNQGAWKTKQFAHTIEIAADALDLTTNRRLVLLLVLLNAAGRFELLELDETRQALPDG